MAIETYQTTKTIQRNASIEIVEVTSGICAVKAKVVTTEDLISTGKAIVYRVCNTREDLFEMIDDPITATLPAGEIIAFTPELRKVIGNFTRSRRVTDLCEECKDPKVVVEHALKNADNVGDALGTYTNGEYVTISGKVLPQPIRFDEGTRMNSFHYDIDLAEHILRGRNDIIALERVGTGAGGQGLRFYWVPSEDERALLSKDNPYFSEFKHDLLGLKAGGANLVDTYNLIFKV